MFDSSDYPRPLDEMLFNTWLEEGRLSKISYQYLLIVWDEFESSYSPVYTEDRNSISQYEPYDNSTGRESLVAVYNLFSESRIYVDN